MVTNNLEHKSPRKTMAGLKLPIWLRIMGVSRCEILSLKEEDRGRDQRHDPETIDQRR